MSPNSQQGGRNSKWKKNFNKIPGFIKRKIRTISSQHIVVSCCKKISLNDINSGIYNHLGITGKEEVGFKKIIIPNPEVGKYSKINLYGKEIKRMDLPKITKTYTWEVPNFGDHSRGYHDVSCDRQVRVREFISPKELDMQISLINRDENYYFFKFELNEKIIKINNPLLEEQIFYNINILQENIGVIDIYSSDAEDKEYLKTIYVDWEILPAGTDNLKEKIMLGLGIKDENTKNKFLGRYNLLEKLKPLEFIHGTNSFRRYFGAKFSNNLVAFENLEYGNAIYVMHESWEKLSKMSRIDLLRMKSRDFVRIIHKSGWENSLKKIILNSNK
jgi:hypothetical protein